MEHSVNLSELLKKIVRHCGSQQRAAAKIGVREETVRSWLKNPDKLSRSHVESVERLKEAAEAMGIEVEGFVQREPLWDAGLDYQCNVEKEPGMPPRLKGEFKSHGVPAFGLLLNSPFGASASVVTSSSARIRYLAGTGADVLTYKTVRSRECHAHMWPNLFYCSRQTPVLDPARRIPQIRVGVLSDEYRPAFGSLNWYGVPCPPVEQWTADFRIAKSYLKSGQVLILSVMGTTEPGEGPDELIADFARVVNQGVDAGASVIELNLSCPNAKAENGKLFRDVAAVASICKLIRMNHPGTKVLLKIGFMVGDELRRFVLETAEYVQGYSAINTLPVEGVREGQEGPEPAFGRNMPTGLGGRPILQHGLKCVYEIATIRETQGLRGITLIGMGGISAPPDALSYLQNGADLVQSANGFIDNPNFGIEVRQYMDAKLPPYLQSVEHESQTAGANWGCAVARVLDDEIGADPERVGVCLAVASKEFEVWHSNRKLTSALGPRRSSVPSADEFYSRISARLPKLSQ